jgi:hypothetical protein
VNRAGRAAGDSAGTIIIILRCVGDLNVTLQRTAAGTQGCFCKRPRPSARVVKLNRGCSLVVVVVVVVNKLIINYDNVSFWDYFIHGLIEAGNLGMSLTIFGIFPSLFVCRCCLDHDLQRMQLLFSLFVEYLKFDGNVHS